MMRTSIVLGLLVSCNLVVACNQKDAAKCDEAMGTTRQALQSGQIDLATRWRQYAYKQCDDAAQLAALDKEIVDRRAQLQADAAEKERKQSQHKQLIALFLQWVGQYRNSPETSVASPTCENEQDAKLKVTKERFCSGSRAITGIEGRTLQARYWEKSPSEAALFSVRSELPTTCTDLGGHRVLGETAVPSSDGKTVKRQHCELTDPSLSGLHALVTEANQADIKVFTAGYPDKDLGFAAQLK